jgi:hypothetical protein
MTARGWTEKCAAAAPAGAEEVYIMTVNGAGEILLLTHGGRNDETGTCRAAGLAMLAAASAWNIRHVQRLSDELYDVIADSRAAYEAGTAAGPRRRWTAPFSVGPPRELCRRGAAAHGDRHHHRQFLFPAGRSL